MNEVLLAKLGDRVTASDGRVYEICRTHQRGSAAEALLGRNIRDYIGTRPFEQDHLIPDGPGHWKELPAWAG